MTGSIAKKFERVRVWSVAPANTFLHPHEQTFELQFFDVGNNWQFAGTWHNRQPTIGEMMFAIAIVFARHHEVNPDRNWFHRLIDQDTGEIFLAMANDTIIYRK